MPLSIHTHTLATHIHLHTYTCVLPHILIPFSWGRDYDGPINLFLKIDLVYGTCRFYIPLEPVVKGFGLLVLFIQDSCCSRIFTSVSKEEKIFILFCQEILTCTQADISITCLC